MYYNTRNFIKNFCYNYKKGRYKYKTSNYFFRKRQWVWKKEYFCICDNRKTVIANRLWSNSNDTVTKEKFT